MLGHVLQGIPLRDQLYLQCLHNTQLAFEMEHGWSIIIQYRGSTVSEKLESLQFELELAPLERDNAHPASLV